MGVGDPHRELKEVALELVVEEKDSRRVVDDDLIEGVMGLLYPELMLDLGGGSGGGGNEFEFGEVGVVGEEA